MTIEPKQGFSFSHSLKLSISMVIVKREMRLKEGYTNGGYEEFKRCKTSPLGTS
jgi:hypothetical protein